MHIRRLVAIRPMALIRKKSCIISLYTEFVLIFLHIFSFTHTHTHVNDQSSRHQLTLLFANLCNSYQCQVVYQLHFQLQGNLSSLSCEMLDLRYVFSIFSFEKERSALATVTGNVCRIHAVASSRTNDILSELIMILSESSTEFAASISVQNSRRRERTSDTKSELLMPSE